MTTLPRQCLVAPPVEHHALAEPRARAARARSISDVGVRAVEGQASGRRHRQPRHRSHRRDGARRWWDGSAREGRSPSSCPPWGATAAPPPEGQREMLAGYGVTERDSRRADRCVDGRRRGRRQRARACARGRRRRVPRGRRRHRREPGEAAHRFRQLRIGSGLLKMSAIGLGKAEGAFRATGRRQDAGLRAGVSATCRRSCCRTLPDAYGVALVEDGSHQLGHIEPLARRGVPRSGAVAARRRARSWMPALPIPEVDVLVVDEIGKNISGAGMDTNIVGRGVDLQPMPNRRADVRVIYVRGLTPESHGNADRHRPGRHRLVSAWSSRWIRSAPTPTRSRR